MNREEEILASCIDEVLSWRSTVEDCLCRFPELRSELEPLLKVAMGILPSKAAPSSEFRQRLRSHLLEVMGPQKAVEHRKEVSHGWLVSLVSVRAVAILVLAFVVLTTGVGSVYAAQSSLPGDVLYPVKIGAEKVQIAVTINPEDKAYLHLKLAQRRIDEVAKQVSLNRTPDVSGLSTVSEQTDAALREIEKADKAGVNAFLGRLAESAVNQQIALGSLLSANLGAASDTVQQTMNVMQRASFIAEAAYNNSVFLNTKPSVRDEGLEQGRFKMDGTLISVSGRTWNIGGVILSNVRFSGEVPSVNSRIKIDGINKNNEVFIIKLAKEEETQEEVKIEGLFKGTDTAGKTWYVGDVPVAAPEGRAPPAQGNKLEVQGVVVRNASGTAPNISPNAPVNPSLVITEVKEQEKEEREKEHEANVEGKLVTVDVVKQVITVKVAGASINVNVSSAKIRTSGGKEINLSKLASLVGKGVKAVGLARQDGIVYAKDVRIDAD